MARKPHPATIQKFVRWYEQDIANGRTVQVRELDSARHIAAIRVATITGCHRTRIQDTRTVYAGPARGNIDLVEWYIVLTPAHNGTNFAIA